MSDTLQAETTARDFDFLLGSWNVANRRLKRRLAGSDDWEEFASTSVARPILDGLGNEDVFTTDHDGGFVGMSFRFFDPERQRWSIYWVSSASGLLQAPVHGRFAGGVGRFEGEDVDGGRAVKVVYLWEEITAASARWSQAFSYDDGATWETNWIMEFQRSA